MSANTSQSFSATEGGRSAESLTLHRRSLRALTGVRFFAALYVVLFHTRVIALFKGPVGNFFLNGYLAVPLFFLLSGFILAYTYAGQIETRGDLRRFWEARFVRIWPLYALSLLLYVPVADHPLPTLPQKIATLLMVQSWDPLNIDLGGAWNFVCWTLSAEAFFYLFFPAAQRLLERRSPRRQLYLLAVLFAVCILMNTSMRTLGYEPRFGLYRYLPLAVIHLPEFLAGVVLGNIYLCQSAKAPLSAWPGVPGKGWWTAVSAITCLALLLRPTGPMTSLVVPAFAALLYGLAAERSLLQRFLSRPLLVLGGGISYGMYLMQTPVKLGLLVIFRWVNLESTGLHLTTEMLGIIAFSWLCFRFVEGPARKLLRNLFASLEKRRGATPIKNT